MSQQNPWEMDWSAPQAPAAPASTSPPAFIPGAVAPSKAAADARATAADARAADDQRRQELTWNATHNPDGTEKPKDPKSQNPTEYQAKSASFLGRMLEAESMFGAVPEDSRDARSAIGQTFHDTLPSVENYTNSPERQKADQAARNFIAASLRQESGAAISAGEFANQYRVFFPMPGDGPDVIKQKAEARRQAIEGFKISAGPLAEQAMATVGKVAPPATGGTMTDDEARKKSVALWGQEVYDQNGKPLIDPNGGGGFDKAGNYLGIVGGTTDDTVNPEVQKLADTEGDQSSLRGLKNLGAQGISLGLSDEAAGVGGFLSAYLTGKNPMHEYDINKAAQNLILDRARQAHPVMGTLAELAGGGGAARTAEGALTVMQAAKQGVGIGALSGFGYGDGAQQSVQNALVGGAGGAVLGAGLQKVGNALTGRAAEAAPDMGVVAAGQRQGVPIRQPDARPGLRGDMAHIETSPRGGPMIREARAADEAMIEQRVADVGGPGNASDPYALGTKVQDAGNRYIARTRAQANRLYDTARQEAGGATVTAKNAVSTLDANIQELTAAGENSNGAAIKYLQGLRQDADRGLTLDSVQNLRTNMRGQLSQNGLTGTDTERRVGQVIDAMNQDLTEQLPQSASAALRAADSFYKERQTFVNGTLKQFLGNKGAPLPAETAASRLTSMTQGKGNYDRFSSMWKELAPEEQADVAATVASSLGRKANGEFSASTLLRSLDPSKGINPRTARLIFGDDGAKALVDLRTIAKAKADTSQALNNSRTGVIVNESANGLKTLLMGALGFGAGGPGGAALGAVSREFVAKWGEQRAARMLLNPDFTKWLKSAPNTANPKAIDRYFGKLAGMASVAANDNQAFVAAIRDGFSKSPVRATATPTGNEKQNGRSVPPQ